MGIHDMIMGRSQPDPALRRIFTPAAGAEPEKGAILASFKGFGRSGVGREGFLGAAERLNLITREQRAAGGAVGHAARGAAEVGERAGFASAAVNAGAAGAAGGAAASANTAPGGLYAQLLMRDQGFHVPMVPAAQMPGDAATAVADEALDAGAPAAATTRAPAAASTADDVAAAADDVAAKVANLEQRLIEGFQRLGGLRAEDRLPTLARAVDSGAVAGHGDDAFGVLASALASRPLEHSVAALDGALDDAARLTAAAAADVATPAAAAKPATTHLAASLGDEGLRSGLRGVMGFGAGIDDTLRLLAKL